MEQLSIFNSGQGLKLPSDLMVYLPGTFNREESVDLMQKLKATIQWKQETIQMYGRLLNTPRLTAWYGENSKTYAFSGKKYDPYPWTPELLFIRQRVEQAAGMGFNSVLLNDYRNGNEFCSLACR
jgi:alkylated DNA repair dioxygenase AlkB